MWFCLQKTYILIRQLSSCMMQLHGMFKQASSKPKYQLWMSMEYPDTSQG